MKQLNQAVDEIYKWLDDQLSTVTANNECSACGRCCNFKAYDHRLYITAAEFVRFVDGIGAENIKPMPNGVCPYQTDGKCSVYSHRFAGCRIFNCKVDPGIQSKLSEEALTKLRAACDNFGFAYKYMELSDALNKADANKGADAI